MDLVNKILEHPKFLNYLELNAKEEIDRKLCHHDLQHSLDVARVAYIISLENALQVDKEMIYIAALLHDIGKWKQYQEKLDHAIEGALLAEEILKDIGVGQVETEIILDAIRSHRTNGEKSTALSEIIYAGDKSCRLCTECTSIKECYRFQNCEKPILNY